MRINSSVFERIFAQISVKKRPGALIKMANAFLILWLSNLADAGNLALPRRRKVQ